MARPDDAGGANSVPEPELLVDPATGLTVMRIPGGRKVTCEEVYALQEAEGLEEAKKWMRKA